MKNLSIRLSLISLFIFACVGIGAPSSASDLTAAPNPLTVQAHTDDTRAVSAVVPIDGGSISATAADGTKFTLTLPKDSLLQETEITLTPITQIDGLPLDGGLLSAVQIEPDGLDLLLPATLTIELGSAIPTDDLLTIGFAYDGDGQEFHLTTSEIQGQTITYSLSHFSGHGSGRGTKANVKKQKQDHPPTKPQDRIEQETDSTLLEQLPVDNSLSDVYLYVVGPRINTAVEAEKAGGDAADAALTDALQSFEIWLQWVKNEGLEDDFFDEIYRSYQLLVQAIKYALDDANKRCLDDDDIEQALRIEKWLRTWESFPFLHKEGLSEYETKVEECRHHFKLKIEITQDGGTSYWNSEAEAPFALQRGGTITGEGTGTLTGKITGAGCTVEYERGATWQVSGTLDTAAHALKTNLVEIQLPYEEAAHCGQPGRGTIPSITAPFAMEDGAAFPIPTQAGETLLLTPSWVGTGEVSLTLLANK